MGCLFDFLLWQAYPDKSDLAKAIKGRFKTLASKKKLSPLKKLIVREKADKAAAAAVEAVAAAKSALQSSEKAQASVRASWQVSRSPPSPRTKHRPLNLLQNGPSKLKPVEKTKD